MKASEKKKYKEWTNMSSDQKVEWNGFYGYCNNERPRDSILGMTQGQIQKHREKMKNLKKVRTK